MQNDSWFIMTSDVDTYSTLLSLGFVEYEHNNDGVYILLNKKGQDVPDHLASKCIFTSRIFLSEKGGE